MFKKNFITGCVALIGAVQGFSQRAGGKIGNVVQLVEQKAQDLIRIGEIVRMVLYGMIGIVIVAKIISILAEKSAGEDKYAKAGLLGAILIIGAFIIWLSENLFG